MPIATFLGRLLALGCLVYFPAAHAEFPQAGKPLRLIVGTPAHFAELMNAERVKWGDLIKRAGLQ